MTIEKIDQELCEACGTCVLACPEDVIRMDEENDVAVIVYPEECQVCAWCADDCPEEAITVELKKGLHIIASWQ